MTSTKEYADSFSTSFREEGLFMSFLNERHEKAAWATRHAKDLWIAPLESDTVLEEKDAPGYTMDDLKGILEDTMETRS